MTEREDSDASWWVMIESSEGEVIYSLKIQRSKSARIWLGAVDDRWGTEVGESEFVCG